MATEIDNLKRQFLEHLEIEKGSSLKTIENYERYLTRFFEFTKIKYERRKQTIATDKLAIENKLIFLIGTPAS